MTNREQHNQDSTSSNDDKISARPRPLGFNLLFPKGMRGSFEELVAAGLERAAKHLPHRHTNDEDPDETEA